MANAMIVNKREETSLWIDMSERMPSKDDLPFLTCIDNDWEFWEDVDWFHELSDDERLAHKRFLPAERLK